MLNIYLLPLLFAVFIGLVWTAELDLDAFFATTYIERVKGTWQSSTNSFLFSCFKDSWNLFNLHHVCIKGGQDGIVVGLESVSNDWVLYSTGDNNFKVSAKDWDNTQGVALSHSLKSVRIKPEDVDSTTLIKGGTIFANCFQQSSDTGRFSCDLVFFSPFLTLHTL